MNDVLFHEKLLRIKNILLDAATYANEWTTKTEDFYESTRLEWLNHARFKHRIPSCIKENRTVSEFRTYSQQYGGYKPRREFVKQIFDEILSELELQDSSPADSLISGKLAQVDSDHIKDVWQKALDRRNSDPEGSITVARTLLESVCKHILDDLGENHDEKTELPKLYSTVATRLNLSPAQHSEQIFKQILGGCHSVVEGLGALRNRHSDAHGKVKGAVKVSGRHAELAVNLAGSMALFLLSTFDSIKERSDTQ